MACNEPNFHENKNYCVFFSLDTVIADLSKSDNNLENTGKSHLRPRAHLGFHCAGTNLQKVTGVTCDILYRISL